MVAGVLALSLWAATLGAEPASAPDEGVRIKVQTYLKLASEFFKNGDYQGALTELKRVDELQELGGVRFNIARCHEELRHPAEALHAYERYLKTSDRSPTAANQQKRAREAIARLEKLVYGSALIKCTPDGVQVQITGVTDGPKDCGSFTRIEAGSYPIVATLSGYRQESGQISVEAGKQAVVEIGMQKETEAPLPEVRNTERAARGALSITGQPAGSPVAVSHGSTTLNGELPWAAKDLEPGSWKVEIGKAGEKRVTREVEVAAGKETRLSVVLSEDEEPAVAVKTVTAAPEDGTSPSHPAGSAHASAGSSMSPKRVGGIVATAVGGALLVTSGALAIVGVQKRSSISNGGLASGAEIQAAADDGTHMNQAAVALLVIGVVVAGTGATLIVLSRDTGESVSLSPLATPGGAGVFVSGSFP